VWEIIQNTIIEAMVSTKSNDAVEQETLAVDTEDDVAAWREVHATLLIAVQKAQEAIAIQKAQRRYWLEEIAWNLDDSGQLANHSIWKRPIRAETTGRKMNGKSSTIGVGVKRKKISYAEKSVSDNQKASKKRKKNKDDIARKKVAKIALKGVGTKHYPAAAVAQSKMVDDGILDIGESIAYERDEEVITSQTSSLDGTDLYNNPEQQEHKHENYLLPLHPDSIHQSPWNYAASAMNQHPISSNIESPQQVQKLVRVQL
jgi:hypothetical protein